VSLEEKETLFRTTAFLTMGQQNNTSEPEIPQMHEPIIIIIIIISLTPIELFSS
jgi:hypothetical protein